MARTTKTKKTVTRKRTVKKNVNTDPDFFKFDDDYENNEIAEKYEANWNNNDAVMRLISGHREGTHSAAPFPVLLKLKYAVLFSIFQRLNFS